MVEQLENTFGFGSRRSKKIYIQPLAGNHNQLFFVLKNTYGLNHKVLEWLHSYLDSRTFSVIAAGSQSQVHNLHVGVPHGSILGPLLFILFTKDLQDVITVHNMHFHFYVDDTRVFLNFQPSRSEFMNQDCLVKLQNCLSDINIWMHNHFLKWVHANTTGAVWRPFKLSLEMHGAAWSHLVYFK